MVTGPTLNGNTPAFADVYPTLATYTHPIARPAHPIVGRGHVIDTLLATFERPEVSNAILLAEAGTGKTAVVQHLAMTDTTRDYLEGDIPAMKAEGPDALATNLSLLFEEVRRYNASKAGKPMVVFFDECHLIMEESRSSVEALKPILAQSGALGLNIIMATTLEEYHEFIAPNQALSERLQRIALAPPARGVVIGVLQDIARKAGVTLDEHLAALIYESADRFMPASAQPRKSINLLDSMIGWYRSSRIRRHGQMAPTPIAMDRALLNQVLEQNANAVIDMSVDPERIEQAINDHVVSQRLAAMRVRERMEISMAGFGDTSRPAGSFMLAGPTGVGKTELVKTFTKALFGADPRRLARFDMTEFSTAADAVRFRDALAQRIWDMPYAVVLLDEVEKAHASVKLMLLQVLDDARLTDRNGRQVTFTNAYIFMTTNAGVDAGVFTTIAQWASSDTGDGERMDEFIDNIRRAITSTDSGSEGAGLKPEFLGRIDTIVPFQPLSGETIRTIVEHKLADLQAFIAEHRHVKLTIDPRVVRYIAEEKAPVEGDPNSGGARYIERVLSGELVTRLAAALNREPDATALNVSLTGIMRIEERTRVKGTARITVETIVPDEIKELRSRSNTVSTSAHRLRTLS